jgi:hypothetical protein
MYYNEITNGCNFLIYVFILICTLHVSGSHKPIIRGMSSCFLIYNHLVHVVFMLFICVCPWSGLSWWFHCTGVVVVSLYWSVVVVSLYWCRGGFTVPVSWWFHCSGVVVVSLYRCRGGFTVPVSLWFHCTGVVVVSLYWCRGGFTLLVCRGGFTVQ